MSKTRKTVGRKRRFTDSDDSDDASPILKSPKKKRRRTLQSSQSDDESRSTNNKPKSKRHYKPKPKKTPNKAHRTPKPLQLTEAKAPPHSISPPACTKPNKHGSSKKKKKKTPVKCHDIRNFFSVSATDYFSKCTNYQNLKTQTIVAMKPVPNAEEHDSDDVDMTQEDIEMKHTSDADDKQPIKAANKPLKRPNKSPPQKRSIINSPFAKLSCHVSPDSDCNPPPAQSTMKDTKPKAKVTGRKRKLEEISHDTKTDNDETPANKKRKWYPGFKRSDAPPQHGQTQIPVGKPYCLSGVRFVITGQLPSLTRDECSDLIKEYGGRVTSAVSGMTRYLICGAEPGQSKTQKAKAKRVTIIDESKFLDLLRTLPAGKAPKMPEKKKGNRNKNSIDSIAAKRAQRQTKTTAVSHELLVDKYKPKSSGDLIGNTKCIETLRTFLTSWDDIKRDKQRKKRGVLLSGQPGIGKTSAIHVIAKELGFGVLEFNASDTRSKKSLRNVVQQSLNNGRISDFFSVKGDNDKKRNNLIIMDEVDGMSSGDRGGIKELIGYISSSLIPIICICNDRGSQKVRSLATHCVDLRFRKPTPYQIRNRLYMIARAEGFQCDLPTIQKLAEGTNGDIRQMLHLLQFWSNDGRQNGAQKLSFNEVNAKLKRMNQKDVSMGPWDVAPKLFYPQTTILKGMEYYFVDYSLIPLFIHENYLTLSLHNGMNHNKFTTKHLDYLCNASDSIADGDIIDNNIRKSQQYAALPYHGVLSTLKPGKYVSCIGRISGRIGFPQWLGKNSSRRKNEKLASELALHMRTSTDCVALDYLTMLKQQCVHPLRVGRGREEDIDAVVQFMKSYDISRADWDTICSLGGFEGANKDKKSKSDVAARVKTKFTRRCTAELGAANKATHKKKKVSANELKVNKEDDAYLEEAEEEEEDDISKDGLIKMRIGKRKNGNKKGTKKKMKKTKRKKTKKKKKKRKLEEY